MTSVRKLTESRKKDRAEMAQLVIEMARNCGAHAELDPDFANHPHELWVRMEAPGGLLLTLDFDGRSPQPDTHVLSWHMHWASPYKLAPAFWTNVNTVHYHKATDVCDGIDDLLETLQHRLLSAVDGRAYQGSKT